MRKIQILTVNQHSNNSASIAVNTDIELLNVDKNSKLIRINHKNIENQINLAINT